MGHFFYCLTGQGRLKTICYKYQLAFLEKGSSYVHSKASLNNSTAHFVQPFGRERNILSAKSLNIFSSLVFGSCTISQQPPTFRGFVSNTRHPRSGRGEGRGEGVTYPWYAREGRLQIDSNNPWQSTIIFALTNG